MVFEDERFGPTSFGCRSGKRGTSGAGKIHQHLSPLDGKCARLEYFAPTLVGTSNSRIFLWRWERRLCGCRNHGGRFKTGAGKNRKARFDDGGSKTRSRCFGHMVFIMVMAHKRF